jgi:hypothetical protein
MWTIWLNLTPLSPKYPLVPSLDHFHALTNTLELYSPRLSFELVSSHGMYIQLTLFLRPSPLSSCL